MSTIPATAHRWTTSVRPLEEATRAAELAHMWSCTRGPIALKLLPTCPSARSSRSHHIAASRTCQLARWHSRTTACSSAGFTTLALCAAMVLMTALLIAGSYLRQSSQARNALDAIQAEAATAAEESIGGFVLANGRLPCPASVRGGVEDCTHSKGWLPVKTLQSDPLAASVLDSAAVRYVVYRGNGLTDPDLAAPADEYAPRKMDGSRAYTAPTIVNAMDFCEALRKIAPNAVESMIWLAAEGTDTTPRRSDRAHVQSASGVTNIAFGVAVAAAGAAESQSGENADFNSTRLEDPDRVVDARYRDVVVARDAASFFNALGCTAAAGALDTAAIASAWSPSALAAKDGTVKAFDRVVEIEGIAVAGAGAGVTGVSGAILNFTWSLVNSTVRMILGPTPQDHIEGAAGVAASTKGLSSSYPELAKEVASSLAEGSNLVGYRVLRDDISQLYVWDASGTSLQHLDALGIQP